MRGNVTPITALFLLTYHPTHVGPGGTAEIIGSIQAFIGFLPDVEI